MCSQNFRRFADDNILVWSGQVWDPEAYGLSMQLRTAAFPFVALLLCQSERSVQIADRVQGYVDDHHLVERLQMAMPIIENVRQGAALRTESTRLREQQDREYRESEEADRRNREQREREEAEMSNRAEREREEKELADAIDLSNRLSRENGIENKRRSLGEEPPLGQDVSLLRFQLPKGVKTSRRFLKTEKIQVE